MSNPTAPERTIALCRAFALAAVLAACPAVADAGDFTHGLAAYRAGDYPTAIAELRPLAVGMASIISARPWARAHVPSPSSASSDTMPIRWATPALNSDPDFIQKMEEGGFAMPNVGPDKMAAFQSEIKARYEALAKEMGITKK